MILEDLSNNLGFRRVKICSDMYLWNPIAMIDKHRPIKLGVNGLLTLLVPHYAMHGENLKNWNIEQPLRYEKFFD